MPPKQTKTEKIKLAVDAIASNKTSIKKKDNENNNKDKEDLNTVNNDENINEFNSSFSVSQKSGDISYKKLELHSQILLRPDTYIGSVKNVQSIEPVYVINPETKKIVLETINFPEGLIRIFIEVISNAIDNVWRSLEYKIIPKTIKISIDKETGVFKVWNDGKNIPVTEHSDEKIPTPELIFGNLLTSSNYNDEEERKTSGRNGYGVKLCNIFSSNFTIRIFNKSEKKIYTQTWTNNMYNKSSPVIEKYTGTEDEKDGFTEVSFTPDYKKFGLSGLTDDIYNLCTKIVYDTAMTVSLNSVKTYFNPGPGSGNSNIIQMNSIKDYVDLYYEQSPDEYMMLKSDDCRVFICPDTQFNQISFVNGIYTKDGGVHVDAWCETIFRPIVDKINGNSKNKKDKKNEVNIRDIKKHFFIFVYASVDKPSFDNQSKTKLNGPAVKTEMKKKDLTLLLKWKFIEDIEESLKIKELQNLKVTERKRGTVKVEGLVDANFAGSKDKAKDCYLCISEGDSAKTYVVKGMAYGIQGKKGHDYIGVLPIRGKFLNVKNASVDVLIKNKEVKSLIQSLGLQHGVDYCEEENFKKLRYGKLMLCTDSDVDGFHITGLILNFFHTLFPSLLKRGGFFYFMRTPIVKITEGRKKLSFFFQSESNKYIEEHKPHHNKIKYYKGLGTSQADDVKEDFGRRIVEVVLDDSGNILMNDIFGKENTEYRKDWLSKYNPNICFTEDVKDYEVEHLSVTDFLNQELILFSLDDCKRSIPSMIDGLKESHRKVLYSAFKRNLKYSGQSLKVAQFAGYVAENSSYHHGEQNLFDTIIKLAQRFVGSNNISLFFNEGQFGSRLELGKDAASARYIFTKLDVLTRLIFREEDEPFLPDREDDGFKIEKEFYMPIIPMILVNGCQGGIGTGWSCFIPCYNPEDIIENIKKWIKGEELEEMIPWYRNFKGMIIADERNITTHGIVSEDISTIGAGAKKKNVFKYNITEIPIGRKNISILKYKEILEELKEDDYIQTICDNSTDEIVNFTIISDEKVSQNHLSLTDTMTTSNMVLFDINQKIKKYNNVLDILKEFCEIRLKYYEIRKKGVIKAIEEDLKYIKNKIRFISAILNNDISLKDRDDDELEEELEEKKYDMKISENGKESYDYLLSIQVRHMTGQRLKDLQEKEKQVNLELNNYKKLSPTDIWLNELDELLKKYKSWMKDNELKK